MRFPQKLRMNKEITNEQIQEYLKPIPLRIDHFIGMLLLFIGSIILTVFFGNWLFVGFIPVYIIGLLTTIFLGIITIIYINEFLKQKK